jgi:hypothetical protein
LKNTKRIQSIDFITAFSKSLHSDILSVIFNGFSIDEKRTQILRLLSFILSTNGHELMFHLERLKEVMAMLHWTYSPDDENGVYISFSHGDKEEGVSVAEFRDLLEVQMTISSLTVKNAFRPNFISRKFHILILTTILSQNRSFFFFDGTLFDALLCFTSLFFLTTMISSKLKRPLWTTLHIFRRRPCPCHLKYQVDSPSLVNLLALMLRLTTITPLRPDSPSQLTLGLLLFIILLRTDSQGTQQQRLRSDSH